MLSLEGSKNSKYEKSDKMRIVYRFDAKNILNLKHIRKKEGDENKKLLETKYFFISTDQGLRDCENYYFKEKPPIILLPSQWLAIILKFVGRTDDDYKSFVSFLTLRSDVDFITNEKIKTILLAITELIDDISLQEHYAEKIIELKSEGIFELNDTDEIYDKTEKYVKNDLEMKLLEVNSELSFTKDNLDSNYVNKNEHNTIVNDLKSRLFEKEIKTEIAKWQLLSSLYIIPLLLSATWFLLHFTFLSWEHNPYLKLTIFYDSLHDLSKLVFVAIDYFATITFSSFVIKTKIPRLFKNSKEYKEKEIEVKQKLSKNEKNIA